VKRLQASAAAGDAQPIAKLLAGSAGLDNKVNISQHNTREGKVVAPCRMHAGVDPREGYFKSSATIR